MMNKTIENWFEEKDSIQGLFEVKDKEGTLHFFDKETVLKTMLNCDYIIKKAIVNRITDIEWNNRNPNNFIKYFLRGFLGNLMVGN